jgi:Zn-dependent protease
MMLLTNVSLGVFNLIPIPPLDGSHVLETLLPASLAEAYGQLRQFGWILLIGLSMLGVFRLVLLPVITFVVRQLYS